MIQNRSEGGEQTIIPRYARHTERGLLIMGQTTTAADRTLPDIPQPARKQVTILFCDVVDYTSRSVEMDPEDLADEIRVVQTICASVAERFHGHIHNYLGDGIMVLFGHPYASEFDPEFAIRAGMEMVRNIEKNNQSSSWSGRSPIQVRVGIATGLVVVGERAGIDRDQDELIFGEAPNLAARLQSLACPNTVVTGLRTRRLVGGAFRFRDLGSFDVKGFEQPLEVWQVLGRRHPEQHTFFSYRRISTPFVSRNAELERLFQNYERAILGKGRAVHITGDAGIGKSRLVRVFEKSVHKQNLNRIRINCSPYTSGTPFKSIIDSSWRWFQISHSEEVSLQQERIAQAMATIELENAIEHALFCQLLSVPAPPGLIPSSISAEETHHLTVTALAEICVRLSRLYPLLLIAEDLQWADASTLSVIEQIIVRSARECLFCVLISRSEFVAPWMRAGRLETLYLEALDPEESAQLIDSVLGSSPVAGSLSGLLVDKCNGIPLFLEESSWHMLEQFSRTGDTGESDIRFSIPDTLQDSLNARLDQLEGAKAFAQLVAVYGSEFSYSTIRPIACDNGIDPDAGMDCLIESGILTVIPDASEDRYAYRHILLQDAAYASLLRKIRQKYHYQIGQQLEGGNPDCAQAEPELLAFHYTRSDRPELAPEFWLRAGIRTIRQSAIVESLQHLYEGLELVDRVQSDEGRDRLKLSLLLHLGVALTARSGYYGDEVTRTYEQALLLAEREGDEHEIWTALYGLWRCLVSSAEFARSIRISIKLRALCGKSRTPGLVMTTHGLQGMTRMVSGKFRSAEHHYDRAIELYDPARDRHMGTQFGQDPYVTIRGLGAVNKLILGKFQESAKDMLASVEVARAIGHPYTVAETLRVACMYHQLEGDLARLTEYAVETIELSEKYGFRGLLAAGRIFLAFGEVVQSGNETGLTSIRDNLDRYAQQYGRLFLPYFHGVHAQAFLHGEHCQDALEAADRGLDITGQFGEAWPIPYLLGMKAEAAARGMLAGYSDIDGWYKQAMEIALKQGAIRFMEQNVRSAGERLDKTLLRAPTRNLITRYQRSQRGTAETARRNQY